MPTYKEQRRKKLNMIFFFLIAIPIVIFLYNPEMFDFLSEKAQTGIQKIKNQIPKNLREEGELLSEDELAKKFTYTSVESALQAFKPRKLSLTAKNLEYVPTNLQKLKYLQVLNLDKNQLKELVLPADSLRYLQYLSISLNRIKKLPVEIGKLENLVRLDATANLLNSLPLEIVNLKKLRTLNLRYNQFEQIPTHLCDLEELDSLMLGFNQIARLPRAMVNLRKLEYLDLEYNRDLDIVHFIDDFKHFQNLKTLRLTGIKISEADKKRIREVVSEKTQVIF
ncbi:MAG: leucine-rich repeat domain-containing protein [Microscillaceae bacterium]|nr:leucine-rich repeat domain-containing protein [Microscillaceae bacterium]MDW8461867.1 leucine-rich repeat domain-containing protein [Cytophagales bacterium]